MAAATSRGDHLLWWGRAAATALGVHRVLRVGPGEGLARRRERNRRGDEETAQVSTHLDNFTPTP